ncbi:MAG: hypothetical protein U0232_13180 [Thermomicrobiales bacterium]
MRIVILTLILFALLLPGLRAEAVAPPAVSLHPTAMLPRASGVVGYTARSGQITLQLDLRGLSPQPTVGVSATRAVYVVWLADADRRLMNAGSFVPTLDGAASAVLGPFPIDPAGLIVAISAEPYADVAAPTAPKTAVALSGQFPRVAARPANGLNSYLGPDWAAPVLPAALGFTLLRQASRSRRAAAR